MTSLLCEESDRRTALRRMIGLAAAPVGLPMLAGALGVDGSTLVASAYAAGNPGAQAGQGDLVHIPGASVPGALIAEWGPGDVNAASGPFKIAASKAAFDKAPATAARYEAKLYNFPSGSLRTLTFKKGGPVMHLITFETEIYVLCGTATLTPLPGHPGDPVTVRAGDALFLPAGYLNSPAASEDFTILQAFVGRTVREARSAIITPRQALSRETVERATAASQDQISEASRTPHRLSLRRYVAEGASIRVGVLRGGRSRISVTSGADVLIYIAQGRTRRKEGDQLLDLAAGDCMRARTGVAGYWEPLEETVFVATDAPMNLDMPPPDIT